MGPSRQQAAMYSTAFCFVDAVSMAARAKATFLPFAFKSLAMRAPESFPRTSLPLKKYSFSGTAGSSGAALAVASSSISSLYSLSLLFSGIAGCLRSASGSLAWKKPESTKGLRASPSSETETWSRKAISSCEAVISPPSYSLASSQSIGASALLASGKRLNAKSVINPLWSLIHAGDLSL